MNDEIKIYSVDEFLKAIFQKTIASKKDDDVTQLFWFRGESSVSWKKRHQLDPVDRKSERRVFDVSYCTISGDIVSGKVVCTSSSFVNDTFNFKFCDSGEVRYGLPVPVYC